MCEDAFSNKDLRQISDHGLTLEEVQKQLGFFKMSPPYQNLVRPCTPGDGIKAITEQEIHVFTETYKVEALKHHCIKFVPASGAATRMFRTPLWFMKQEKEIMREPIAREAEAGQKNAQEFLAFMHGVRKFAFFEDLKSVMSEKGLDVDSFLEKGRFTEIIRYLLTEKGLNYANLPKGLLKFHKYPDGSRSAFEEHLVEAASYVLNQNRECFLHFTVSPEHMEEFQDLFKRVKSYYENKYAVAFHVTFSIQKKSTDTIAVDLNNNPFRQKDGRLLFRPGGHGALIENLNDLKEDIIFIKNVDNVVPDQLKPETFKWKKIMGGYLIAMQDQIFAYMQKLASEALNEAFLDRVSDFVRNELFLAVPVFTEDHSAEEKRLLLMEKLNRPIRVCGMVKNVGEPGGGPFWVKDRKGETSLQIIETAQIDPDSKDQQAILTSCTHFNPVDLVCGIRDWEGRPFDLRKHVDPDAVFISQKSKDGRDLKALERPGLWNGAMAHWITIFVEVPGITFNPVKTVNDLLRKEHQPG